MATTRSREELAKAYAIKTLEMSRATLMVTMGPSAVRIINQIDWDLVATPLTALLLERLTLSELQDMVAWVEGPLYEKMVAMAPDVMKATEAGFKIGFLPK